MNYTRALSIVTVLVLLLGLTGCAALNKVVLHPIEDSDIVDMREGTSYTSKKSGWFVSDYYMREVMNAKID